MQEDEFDAFELERFVTAQAATYATALAELRAGEKRTHWMWFVFPQIAGLGSSAMAVRYAIRNLDEARAYLKHPLLGPRLRECAEALLAVRGRAIEDILGFPDDLKLKSSMTLFESAEPNDGPGSVFARVLDRYYDGERDTATLDRLMRDTGRTT